MTGRTTHLVQAALGFGIGGGLLYLSLRNVDRPTLWRVLTGIEARVFVPCLIAVLALLTCFFWLKAIRWSWLLRPLAPLRTGEVLPALMIGFMFNNILPAHLGEFVRMYVLAKVRGFSKTAVLSTIVLERVLDFLTIVAVFAITLQFVPMSDDLRKVRLVGYVLGAACIAMFLCFLFYVWRAETAIHITEKCMFWVPRRLRDKLLTLLTLGIPGLCSLRNPWLFLRIVAVTLAHWSLNGIMLYLATIAFSPPESLPLLAAFFLMSVSALGITLPTAPGYVGTTQYCFVVALAPFGIGEETAFAGSLLALLLGIVPVTLAGLFFAARLGLKIRTLKEAAEKGETPNGDAPQGPSAPPRPAPPDSPA